MIICTACNCSTCNLCRLQFLTHVQPILMHARTHAMSAWTQNQVYLLPVYVSLKAPKFRCPGVAQAVSLPDFSCPCGMGSAPGVGVFHSARGPGTRTPWLGPHPSKGTKTPRQMPP